MARRAITAMGTTTAIAIMPPFDNPLEEVDGREVAVLVDDVEVFEVVGDDVTGVDVEVGSNVLVEV